MSQFQITQRYHPKDQKIVKMIAEKLPFDELIFVKLKYWCDFDEEELEQILKISKEQVRKLNESVNSKLQFEFYKKASAQNPHSDLKPLCLYWFDPRDHSFSFAGNAKYSERYCEYALHIDEEPSNKRYFLKPTSQESNQLKYQVDLLVPDENGKYVNRQKVGEGILVRSRQRQIHIDYGSKFKTLVLAL